MLASLRFSRNTLLRSVSKQSVFTFHTSPLRCEESKDKESQPPKDESKNLLVEKDKQIAELKVYWFLIRYLLLGSLPS